MLLSQKPTAEFFDTLGLYVYEYLDEEGQILYIGKGIGDRCLHHIDDKGYDIEHCYIVASNLEKFESKPSLLLESFLIKTRTPRDNLVSGHYTECFTMARVVSLFSDRKSTRLNSSHIPLSRMPSSA